MGAIIRLKRRITGLLFSVTGAILLFTLVISCQLSIEGIRATHIETFNARFTSYVSGLQSRHAVDIVGTMRFEQEHDVIIRVYDSGTALLPTIPVHGTASEELISLAEQQFSPAGGFSNIPGRLNVSTAELGEWAGEYQIVSAGSSWYGVLMLQSQENLTVEIRAAIMLYAGILLAALVCLFLLSWFLSGVVAKPIGRAYRQQLEFTAAASHDLRTPTAIIKSSAQIILQNPETATANAEKVVRECDRLAHLLEDMLMLSAGEAGLLTIEMGEVNPETELIRLYEQFTPLVERSGLELNLDFPDASLPTVRGDKNRVYQILSAFIENALEYGKESGIIEMTAEQSGRYVLLKVRDHGPGIPDGQKHLVFNQFHQADKSRSNKEHFGLGLSIAQKLAMAQHASVWVEDTPGGGATFVLKLKAF